MENNNLQSQPVSFDAPLQQPTNITVAAPVGVTFDDPLTSPQTLDAIPGSNGSQQQPQGLQQPSTGLQKAISSIKGENDPDGSWYPELGDELSGGIKSASNGLAGIIDLINKPHGQLLQPPSQDSVKATIDFYRRVHPEATAQQAASFVQQNINAGKQPFSSNLQDVADWLHSGGQPNGFWENVGSLGEQALEWIGGNGLLKMAGAPVAAAKAGSAAIDTVGHIAQAGQVAKVLQENPRLAGLVSIGLKASKDALVEGGKDALVNGSKNAVALGAQNYLHTEDPNTAMGVGLTGGLLSGAGSIGSALFSKAGDTIRAINAATDEGAVQDALQDHVRDVLDKVAVDTGVDKPTAPSLRDAVGELAKSVEAKASGLYSQIDEALRTPGNTYTTNYKTFDQQLKNVRRELSMSSGIDPDADANLIEREAQLTDAKQQAMELAASKGVPANTGKVADQYWAQSKALQDVQKALQKSAIGLRPELAGDAASAANASPETVTPTLAKRLNDLFNKGRLQQALSPANADDLLRSVEVANLKAKQAIAAKAAVKAGIGTISKGAAAVGLGAGGGAIATEGVRHYLGN